MTVEAVRKHLPTSMATIKGHMHRTPKNVRSTKHNMNHSTNDELDDLHPPQNTTAPCELFCFAALADTMAKTLYTDITGCFPVRSYRGHQYIFLAYVYDVNAILVRPMKSRTNTSIQSAFTDVYDYLKQRNLTPKLHVMDNECSKDIQRFVKANNTKIQFVKPHQHRVNAAE